ncbi:MAG: hypothetical protein K0U38_06890 [Epsilonproteobacteria bacterium]|nr:hypothetical protein [Campylobacterota bacterium]
MKKTTISIISMLLLLFTTSCSSSSPQSEQKVIALEETGNNGGNPEVKKIHKCFGYENEARSECLDKLFPEEINIKIYPPSGERVKLAGRNSSAEKVEFNLKGQERFIFNVETSQVKLPISCNVSTRLFQSDNRLTVDVAVKDIDDKVTLYDREGKVLLDYTVVK